MTTNYRDESKLRPATREWLALLKTGDVWVSYCTVCGLSARVGKCSDCGAPEMCERCHAEHGPNCTPRRAA